VIFTLEVDGKPILAFEAASELDAQAITELEELRSDLRLVTSNGDPVCACNSKLIARPARDNEVSTYRYAAKVNSDDCAPTFVFLVRVDGLVLHVVDSRN
jgi:hypothetical protein